MARSSAMTLTPLSVVVWLLFAASGAAALIYEIVWQQLLQLVIGSSTVSLGVLLAMFMGGMCVGSFYAPRLVPPRRHPLRVYAVLELAIGGCGLALLAAMPLIERFYTAWGGEGVGGVLVRALVAAACLLPPTCAMGATLPVISRWVEADAARRFATGTVLCRQHPRRRRRMPRGRVLSAPRVRHERRDVRRGGGECDRRGQFLAGREERRISPA